MKQMERTVANNKINGTDNSLDQDNQKLKFRISTGLKRVLGRELITDDEVAIFELVKNSFDAGAKDVYIHFLPNAITIADDGCGMSYDDIRDKWLFVAYSAKRNNYRSDKLESYRDQVTTHQQYAGSKGIGRFASDRLGQLLVLQTRPAKDKNGVVHKLVINWSEFEADDTEQFGEIDVQYDEAKEFVLPESIPAREHGTIIQIRNLTKEWTREDLLRLKSGLTKLINPFGATVDGFRITIVANDQDVRDKAAIAKAKRNDPDTSTEGVAVVNGPVGNFIFSTLREKTTFISVTLDPITNTIESSLIDRGELIYRIREPNKFPLLRNSEFSCQLYFLNRAAKATFARRVGLAAVRFGSVFLFRNGFRVFPVGEEGDDWFGIDRRKQQGYARFLGTRDIIGRIDVFGSEALFQESSSRNQGLIETPAVAQMKKCFWDHCLKRLERYVVPVSWGTKDVETETLAYIESDSGRARVSAAVASLIGSEEIEVIQYSTRLIDTLNERSEQFESSLANLRVIAASTGDKNLAARISEAEDRFAEIKQAEAEARRLADQERRAKQEAEAKAASAIADAQIAKEQLGEERKRNLFLTSISTLDIDTILNMHHSITIYAGNLQEQAQNFLKKISSMSEVPVDMVSSRLESIILANKQVLAVARFATKANFRLQSEYIEEDFVQYVVSYINEIAIAFLDIPINVRVETDGKEFVRRFKPIDIAIVIDNLINNASKAGSSVITFNMRQPRKGMLEMLVSDDGRGISAQVAGEGRLFEKGYTTTNGSGLGLYHVRQVLSGMDATIEVVEEADNSRGATFLLRVPA
jgi:signal transduction histidine kinase